MQVISQSQCTGLKRNYDLIIS